MAQHLLTNDHWRQLVAELLTGKADARAVLRGRVEFYIRHLAPVRARGSRDTDRWRRQLAAKVLHTLEADDFRMLRAWHDRERDVPDWWTWIKTVTLFVDRTALQAIWVPRNDWPGPLAEGTKAGDTSSGG